MMKRSLATKNLCKLSSSAVAVMETVSATGAPTTGTNNSSMKPKTNLYLKHDTSDYSLDLLPTFYAARDECWDRQLDELIELFASSPSSSSPSSQILTMPPRITMNFIQHMVITSRV
jgi:hypothetical protein